MKNNPITKENNAKNVFFALIWDYQAKKRIILLFRLLKRFSYASPRCISQKYCQVRCICFALNLSWLKCSSILFLRYEPPAEVHVFSFQAEQVLQKLWGEIFRMEFLLALIMRQTARTIWSPFEGSSLKKTDFGYFQLSTQNERLSHTRFHNDSTFWVESWKPQKMKTPVP